MPEVRNQAPRERGEDEREGERPRSPRGPALLVVALVLVVIAREAGIARRAAAHSGEHAQAGAQQAPAASAEITAVAAGTQRQPGTFKAASSTSALPAKAPHGGRSAVVSAATA